jgi:hypothetical protein
MTINGRKRPARTAAAKTMRAAVVEDFARPLVVKQVAKPVAGHDSAAVHPCRTTREGDHDRTAAAHQEIRRPLRTAEPQARRRRHQRHHPAGCRHRLPRSEQGRKSTTMRMVLGLDRPTSGAALVNGRPYVDSPAPLVEVGALLDAGAVESSQRAQPPACPRCHGRQRAATRGRRARIGRPDRSGPQVRRLVLAGMGQRLASPRRCWPTRPS